MEVTAPPDFVKIDVEGAEFLVLQGASRLLSDVRPSIYIEVSNRNISAVTDVLHGAGYKLFAPDNLNDEIDRCVFNTIALPG